MKSNIFNVLIHFFTLEESKLETLFTGAKAKARKLAVNFVNVAIPLIIKGATTVEQLEANPEFSTVIALIPTEYQGQVKQILAETSSAASTAGNSIVMLSVQTGLIAAITMVIDGDTTDALIEFRKISHALSTDTPVA